MPLTFLPGQFNDRADFYHQIATLISAGFGLPHALEQLRDHPPSRSFRQPLNRILLHLGEGYTFAESLQRAGTWMPDFDVSLLEAGEKSGRLDACLKLLADYYTERTQLARSVINEMLYPVFLLHFALLIFGLISYFATWDLKALLWRTVGVLVPAYLVVGLGIFLMQGSRGRSIRIIVEKLLGLIPLIGRARRHLALARLAMSLESLLNAGVNIINAWELAARAAGSPSLERVVASWREQIEGGVLPSELLRSHRQFPSVFANLYATGEASGRLDDHLGRIHTYYQESATSTLRQVAAWTPRVIYLVIAVWIGYQVVKFYQGYFERAFELSDF